METGNDDNTIQSLLKQNKALLEENNFLLKKIRRTGAIGFWFRIVWYLVLIGLPFALYFYILEPYFNALGSNYEVFKAGIGEIPGLRGLDTLLESFGQ